MPTRFQIGDKVKRIKGEHGGLRRGDTGVVAALRGGGKIELVGYPGWWHDADNLELVAPLDFVDQHAPGAKLDDGKLKPDLILEDMARALTEVIKVATFGANKYTEGGWLQVPNGQVRYRRAQMRHALARAAGEECDSESNLPHLAHEAWNALARLELALREKAGK